MKYINTFLDNINQCNLLYFMLILAIIYLFFNVKIKKKGKIK